MVSPQIVLLILFTMQSYKFYYTQLYVYHWFHVQLTGNAEHRAQGKNYLLGCMILARLKGQYRHVQTFNRAWNRHPCLR